MSRTFTIDQANSTLPLVRRIVEDIVRAYEPWRALVEEYEVVAAASSAAEPDERASEIERAVQARAAEIDGYVAELAQIGVDFKGFDLGLVDFPSEMDGRIVSLCWRLGEPAVQFWHEVDAGFAGRRPIAPVAAT